MRLRERALSATHRASSTALLGIVPRALRGERGRRVTGGALACRNFAASLVTRPPCAAAGAAGAGRRAATDWALGLSAVRRPRLQRGAQRERNHERIPIYGAGLGIQYRSGLRIQLTGMRDTRPSAAPTADPDARARGGGVPAGPARALFYVQERYLSVSACRSIFVRRTQILTLLANISMPPSPARPEYGGKVQPRY